MGLILFVLILVGILFYVSGVKFAITMLAAGALMFWIEDKLKKK